MSESPAEYPAPSSESEITLSATDRASAATARRVIETLIPDAHVRESYIRLLVEYIETANESNPASWSITLFGNIVRLNVGRLVALSLYRHGMYSYFNTIDIMIEDRDMLEKAWPIQQAGTSSVMKDVSQAWIPHSLIVDMLPVMERLGLSYVKTRARAVRRGAYFSFHSPGVVSYLREVADGAVPEPNYGEEMIRQDSAQPRNDASGSLARIGAPPRNLGESLDVASAAMALAYMPSQLATFFTALQTKGFVILSGISGTGKTKLVQAFAELLREPLPGAVDDHPRSPDDDDTPDGAIFVRYQVIMLSQGHINLKPSLMQELRLSTANATQRVPVHLGDQMVEGRLDLHPNQGEPNLHLTINNPLRSWLRNQPAPAGLWLTPDFDADGSLATVRLSRSATASRAVAPRSADAAGGSNTLFLSVRPDWRDSKSLLGYFNPLLGTYQETDFLRFIQRAAADYRANVEQASPWFVVLDEMNLAHVEYYFADLLSVLESGRDDAGWTRERLRLGGDAAPEGEAPADMQLPPNLYIVGTVNIDETTHAFSPKVLDRAFSMELTEVDFRDYPPVAPAEGDALTDDERRALLAAFTRNGRFARLDKRELADYIAQHPEIRDWLQALNERLAPRNLHFGYRVFDEIVGFLAAADENGLFDGLGPLAAFDAAVLMKVLPKFHGSRGKLEGALLDVQGWCADPAAPAPLAAADTQTARDYALPRTAARVRRMLDELRVVGYTAFG